MITFLNLMTAIFWGQFSRCQFDKSNYSDYLCSQPTAYGTVSAFAVLIFLFNVALTIAVFSWRGEIISEAYEPVSTRSPYEVKGSLFSQEESSSISVDL